MVNLTIDDLKKDHKVLYDLAKKHRYNQNKIDNTDTSIINSFNWSHSDAEGHNFWSYVSNGDFVKAYELRPDLKTPSSTSSPLTRNGISVGDWYVITIDYVNIHINNKSETCKKGKVINIIDIEDCKYHLSATEYIPNLNCILYGTFKCADKCAAEIYAYELLNPTGVKTIDPTSSVSGSVSGYLVTPPKPVSKLLPYIAECKERFKIGDTVRNHYGSVFTIENLNFFETAIGVEYNSGRDGAYDTCVYHPTDGFAEIISKAKTPLEEALEECKKRYSIGMNITSIMGTTFVIDNVNFQITNQYITLNSKTAGYCIIYNTEGNQYATINTVSAIDEAFAECKRRFSPGDKIKSLGGMVFILSNEKIETSSNYVCVKNQNNLTVGGRFYPNIASLKEDGTIMYAELLEKDCKLEPEPSNLHEYEKNKQIMIEALNHIKSTFLEGMSIMTAKGEEFDLVGDFEFTLDEDDDCIYLEDECGDYFCVYDFEDDVYPTIIESVIHEPGIIDTSNVFWKEIKPMPSFKKEIKESSLEASLVLLPVKSLTIN